MADLADPRASRAVLIGVGDYQRMPALATVPPGVDALRVALTDPRLWGLPMAHCRLLRDPRSVDEVLTAVRETAAAATDLFVLHFSGHGFVDPDTDELYLALPATQQDRPWTALPYQWVRRALLHPAVRARRKLIILDCCFSGLALAGSLGTRDRIGDHTAVDGVCVLTATAETRTALAPRGEPYTAFTGELLSILTRGVTGGPPVLDTEAVFGQLHQRLQARGRPLPQLRSRNAGNRIPLVRNLAGPAAPSPPVPPRTRRLPLLATALATVMLLGADATPDDARQLPPIDVSASCAAPAATPAAGPADSLAIAAERQTLRSRRQIVIGTMFGRPGHAVRCPDGSLRGFDVAIGQLVAADLGFGPGRIDWVDLPPVERLDAVRQHHVDLVVGSMAITEVRKQSIAFAGPYERTAQALMVAGVTTAIGGPDDLRDQRRSVCTVADSTSAEFLQSHGARVTTASGIPDCVRLLLAGKVSAVSSDRSVLLGFLQILGTRVKLVGPSFGEIGYGIAVAKDNPSLRAALHDVLRNSYTDGRYARAWQDTLGSLVPEVATGPPLEN